MTHLSFLPVKERCSKRCLAEQEATKLTRGE